MPSRPAPSQCGQRLLLDALERQRDLRIKVRAAREASMLEDARSLAAETIVPSLRLPGFPGESASCERAVRLAERLGALALSAYS